MSPRELESGGAQDVFFASRLAAVARRIRTSDILHAVTAGAAVAVVVLLAAGASGARPRAALTLSALAALAVLAGLVMRRCRSWKPAAAARLLERARPDSRNVIVTAEELLRTPGTTRAAVRARVVKDAVSSAREVAAAEAVPLRGPAILCAVALLAWVGASLGLQQYAALARRDAAVQPGGDSVHDDSGPPQVTATLTPPAYLGTKTQRLENPVRLEAIAGTRLRLTVAGQNRQWRVRLGPKPLEPVPAGRTIVTEVTLRESGYLVVEDASRTVRADERRLIPVVVTPDRAPAILVEQPGKDLLLPDSSGTIQVSTTATDDFGLSSLEVRFTKVSGSGEQFEFEEGAIPLRLDRQSSRLWKGRAALALAGMQLQPGDSLVYRVVGADGRSGEAGVASSDTFFVEIAGPDQVSPAGFELPPDRERHALSQQMIVLKIQRLRAREQSMSRDAVVEAAAAIAAEQRSVRANFIFLTGGHVENEEEEAEHSHEIQEGRLAHSARREIGEAIQHMSRAEQALSAVDTAAALPPARAAVEALQRAFGRNRYFLRTLPVRSRINPARRLSGDLDEATSSRRGLRDPVPNPASLTARSILAELLDLAPALAPGGRLDAGRFTSLAERALAADAASQEWQQISAKLLRLRDSAETNPNPSVFHEELRAVISELRVLARRDAVSPAFPDRHNRSLRSAWSDRGTRP